MSLLLRTIDPQGKELKATLNGQKLRDYIFDADKYRRASTPHPASTSNIYQCADGKWFQTHGGLNPDHMLDALGLPHDSPAANFEESWVPFMEKISKIPSADLLKTVTDARQAGDIVNSVSEYFASEQGKANAHVGLFEMSHVAS